jgi:hypothetical protein
MWGVNVKGRITYIGIKASLETRFEEATVDKAAPEDDTEKISLNFWRCPINHGGRRENCKGWKRVRANLSPLAQNLGSRRKTVALSKGARWTRSDEV